MTDHTPQEHEPRAEPSSSPAEGEAQARATHPHHLILATLAVFLVLLILLAVTGRMESLAQNLLRGFSRAPIVEEIAGTAESEPAPRERGVYTFGDLDIHPDIVHQPYTAGPVLSDAPSGSHDLVNDFRDLLALYEQRMGTDDNFTIRVVDNRSGDLLELYVLAEERAQFEEEGDAHWGTIDNKRRVLTRQLVDKYAQRGIPRGAITVKWGRADQVRQARQRDLPYIEYEVALARLLGLSLLPTEIGTVETFNQDRLVSSVGARSRYQMMPYLLRQNDIHHYSLRTASGNTISVFEEWHPLLTMLPAFTTLKAYINTVGHELPGISAYHTGPGNIFMVLRKYLTAEPDRFSRNSSVVDAYMWAVTEGFDAVSRGTSFGSYSRGYVASAYGALRATEKLPIDTSFTVRAERVQIAPGKEVYLSQLLRTLKQEEEHLQWNEPLHQGSFYERFRELNPHIGLPEATDSTTVPVRGDLRLTSEAGGVPVRFFLPLGATKALQGAGLDVLDEEATFRFTRNAFGDPYRQKTMWDREYDELVQDIGNFGFTSENKQRLWELEDRFEQLYEASPTLYRRLQLNIIRTQKQMWGTAAWQNLAEATSAAAGRLKAPPRPPSQVSPAAASSPTADLGR